MPAILPTEKLHFSEQSIKNFFIIFVDYWVFLIVALKELCKYSDTISNIKYIYVHTYKLCDVP